jgi:hypothetical protein
VDRVDEVAEVAAEPVELPDDERVAPAQRLEAGGEPGPVVAPARREVLVEVRGIDPGGDERVALEVRDLGPVRLGHPHVPDQHERLCSMNVRLCDFTEHASNVLSSFSKDHAIQASSPVDISQPLPASWGLGTSATQHR